MPRSYRVFDDEHCTYFITSTIVNWLPVFIDKPYFEIVVESLKFIRANKGVQIGAFVVMPTHLHLVCLPGEKVNLSNVIRDFKRFTSQALSTQLEQDRREIWLRVLARHAPGRAGAEYRVWQEGFHPEAIHSAGFARQKFEYVHNNPVRKGLVDAPEHWRYSSARNYVLDDDSVMEIDRLEL